MKKKNIAHIGTCSAILALLFGAGALSLHTNAALRGDINEDGKIKAEKYPETTETIPDNKLQ